MSLHALAATLDDLYFEKPIVRSGYYSIDGVHSAHSGRCVGSSRCSRCSGISLKDGVEGERVTFFHWICGNG